MRGICARVGVAALAAALFIPLVGMTSAHALGPCDAPIANPIVCENSKPGVPPSYWQVQGAGDSGLQGFGTSMSVNQGDSIGFKVSSVSTWHYDILRLGWYGGNGARLIASGLTPDAAQPQAQPPCITDANIGLVDCGNWDLSATYQVPSDAVSGVYIALMTRDDTGGQSEITFVVRNDSSHSDMVVQTSDTTWEAYNPYGGFSLYQGSNAAHRAYKVSYNRPFITVANDSRNWWPNAELPMWQYLERNGYDISYISGIDTDQRGSLLLNHKVFVDSGHDEYWSGAQRLNVDAARDAGVSIASFSGNTAYWKTRYEPSVDGTNTPYRTLVTYKESLDNAVTDPQSPTWTGLWRDTRFSPPEDGGHPENALLGQISTSICCQDTISVAADDSAMRLWRNSPIANMSPGMTHALTAGSLGYEFDTDVDNGFQPAGLIRASTTTVTEPSIIKDFSQTTGAGTVTHHLTEYRAPSGALVFDAGTINWSYTLMGDKTGDAADPSAQQATVNVFADMGVQPATPDATLAPATASTDTTPPTSTITSPVPGAVLPHGTLVTVSGTATDAGGGVVAGVEVSTDGGATWHPATGRGQWSYMWSTAGDGAVTVMSRAVDDSGNLETPSADVNVTVNCPCSLFATATPTTPNATDNQAVEVGTRFHASTNGYISGVRFYKGSTNTGAHIGNLWTTSGTLLATATFTNESASGWQQVNFSSAVAVTANTDYIVSYHTNVGRYAVDPRYFYTASDATPLHAPANSAATPNGVYSYGATSKFPTSTSSASNYWVDVVFTTDATPPSILSTTPSNGSTAIAPSATVSASFTKPVQGSTVSLVVTAPDNTTVPGTVSFNSATSTVTLTPSSPMNPLTTYTATVSDALDGGGNPMPGPFSWSFTTTSFAPCPCSVWAPSATPTTLAASDTHSVELGLKFRADANGYVTGVRFYKGTTNTGVHTGTLWSSSGTQLATATFSGESASGWQQVNFSRWVAVTANTTYVVSYHTSVGHYSSSANALTSGVDNPPLHALANGLDGPNAVFTYTTGVVFPTTSSNNVNYWVDPVYQLANAAPAVTTTTPANGATGVAASTAVSVVFGKTVQGSPVQMALVDAAGTTVPATVSFDVPSNTASLTPTTRLNQATVYTVTVSGVVDLTGVPMTAPYSWSFTTAGSPTCPCSIFSPSATPTTASVTDAKAAELGVKFRSDVGGYVKSVRFYKGATNTGVHVGNLWTSTGTRLATATFSGESATGWQQVDFATPVLINPGTTYVASYHTNVGHYSATTGGLTNAVDAPPLHALANGVDGSNAVFLYSAASAFPTTAANGTNYFVDVVFDSAPQVVGRTPYPGATSVSRTAPLTATFNKPVNAASIGFAVVDSSNQPVVGTTTYDAPSQTATFTPGAPLNPLTNYTATISGVVDTNGQAMAAPYTWSFTAAPLPVFVVDHTPSIDATDVPFNVAPTATFGEPILPASVSFTVRDATNHVVAGSLSFSPDNTVATFTPSAPLAAAATYTIVVSGAATADQKAMPGPQSWSFTTTAPPTVISRTPTPNATGVSLGTTVTVNFSRPVVAGSPAFAVVDDGGNPVTGTVTSNDAGTAATFTPDAPLAPGTTYSVTVSGATSLGGAVMSPATRTFTSAARPTISASAPGPDAADVARAATTAVGFSETVTGASIVVTDADSNVIAGSTAYNAATNTATFTPSGLLDQQTTYTVTVSGATNGAGAQMLPVSWSFTTTAPPAVVTRSPAPSATGVALATPVTVAFDRAVATGSPAFHVVDGAGNTVAGDVSLDGEGTSTTFTPSAPLAPSTTYTVTLSGAVSSGGAIMAPVTWSFTTADRPTVVAQSPAPGATTVDLNTTVAIGFSQDVTGQTIVVTDPSSAVVDGSTTYDSTTNTATFTPTSALNPSVTYNVAVSGATNGVGATMLPASWSFATSIPPTVTSQSPAASATGVPLGTTVSVGFDRPVATGSTNFQVLNGSSPVSGSVALNAAGTVASFTPDAALAPSTTYTVTASGATALGGAAMMPLTWTFITVARPAVTAQTPAPGATNVAGGSTVSIGFDQAVTGATLVVTDPGGTAVAGSTAYDATTNTATFTPSGPLSSGLTYTVTASGATGAAGATMSLVSWSFSTALAPSVTSQSPAPGATGVALGTTVSADFDQPVVSGSTTFQVAAGGTPAAGSLAFNAAGTLATFTPSAAFAPSTTYTVTVSGSAAVGSGPMGSVTWAFTTAARPTVTAQTPAPGATGVAVNTTASVGFNQAVTGATLAVTGPGGIAVAGSTAYSAATNTATFTPSAALGVGTTYTVTASGATNAAAASMTLVSWSFTTVAPTPTATTHTPATGATGAALGTTVTVGFDRAVANGSTVIQVVNGSTTVAGTVALSGAGNLATFTPSAALAPSTTYTVTVSGATASGSAAMTPVTWTFTTAARPTVISQSPASGATNVALNTTVSAGFNQAVTGATLVVTAPGGGVVAGSTAYNATTNVATFTPSAQLSSATTYTAVASGATNASGASMTPLTWSFTTLAAPSVTARTPAASATGVALNSTVSVTFDRAVVSGTTSIQVVTGSTTLTGSLRLTGGGTVATFTPSAALVPGTTYTVTVSGAKAVTGGAVMSTVTWTFTTQPRPTVTLLTPAAGATNVAVNSTVAIAFSESVTGAVGTITDPAGNAVSGSTAYNAATNTATFTPSTAWNANTTYTVTVSGATNAAGATMLPFTSSFNTINFGCPCQLFATSATPSTTTVSDFSSSELGVRFKADTNGFITGVRFYKGTSNGGTHTGSLWTNTGTLLGRVTFSGESSSGWQQANFTTPVGVTAGTLYVISYHATSGRYSQSSNVFSGGGAVDNGPMHAPTGNGFLLHTSSLSFPANTTATGANYFVDAVFTPAAAPTVTAVSPTNGSTRVSTRTNLTAQFNVPVQSSGLTFTLVDGTGHTVNGVVSLDSTRMIATFNPSGTLARSTFTASVRAKDTFGNQMVLPVTWSFST